MRILGVPWLTLTPRLGHADCPTVVYSTVVVTLVICWERPWRVSSACNLLLYWLPKNFFHLLPTLIKTAHTVVTTGGNTGSHTDHLTLVDGLGHRDADPQTVGRLRAVRGSQVVTVRQLQPLED